jgi:hypothetical protein
MVLRTTTQSPENLGDIMTIIRSDAFGPTYSDRDRVLRENDPFGSASPVPNPNSATEKQLDFLLRLAIERGINLRGDDQLSAALDKLTKREASEMIEKFLRIPKIQAPVKTAAPVEPNAPAARKPLPNGTPVAEEGMYLVSLDGGPVMSIYKVQRAVHGSGKLYAKVLVIDTEPVRDADGTVIEPAECHFDYAPGVIYRLRPEHKMTIEQMKNFGALYGSCCFCAKTLTDEDSIHNGYGRKCASNRGLPYEKAPKIKL